MKILDYKKWIEAGEQTHDSSSVICLNLLKAIGVKDIALAGFDGFSVSINENYADPDLRRPVNEEQAKRRNEYYKRFISEIASFGIKITFVTPSKYK